MRKAKCALCHGKTARKLPCRHCCCEQCDELLKAHNVIREMCKVGFDSAEQIEVKDSLCLTCAKLDGTTDVAELDGNCLDKIRQQCDWNGYFEDAKKRLKNMFDGLSGMMKDEMKQWLGVIDECIEEQRGIEELKRGAVMTFLEELKFDKVRQCGTMLLDIQDTLMRLKAQEIAFKWQKNLTECPVRIQQILNWHCVLNGNVESWKCIKTDIPANGNGFAVFDAVRRLIAEIVGRNVFLTCLDNGKTRSYHHLMPFEVGIDVVFDGKSNVYCRV